MRRTAGIIAVLFAAVGIFAGCSSDSDSTGGGGTGDLPDLRFFGFYQGTATTVEQGQSVAVMRSYYNREGDGDERAMPTSPHAIEDVGSFDVSYYFSADETLDTETDILMTPVEHISGLTSGEVVTDSDYVLDIPASLAAGSYTVFGVLDSGEDIDESDETNNVRSFQSIDVVEPDGRKPNIGVCGTSYNSVVTQGEDAWYEVQVTNRGAVNSVSGCAGQLYMSDDNVYDAGDYLITPADLDIRPLAVGERHIIEINYTVPMTYSGDVYLFFVVDVDDEIDESLENDNVDQSSLTVNVP